MDYFTVSALWLKTVNSKSGRGVLMEKRNPPGRLESCPYPLVPAAGFSSGKAATFSSSVGIEPVEGGYTECFVHPVGDNYKCELCHRVLCNPRQTECGHRFCETCLNALLSFPDAICPVDQQPLTAAKTFADAFCRKEVLGLKVYCRNHKAGCSEQVPLGFLGQHLVECNYQLVQCPLSGCQEKVQRYSLSDHLSLTCKYRTYKCQHCQQDVIVNHLQTHEEKECPSAQLPCPNGCGIPPMPQSQVKSHLLECPRTERSCGFSKYGCTFRKVEHQSSMQKMSAKIEQLEKEVSELRHISEWKKQLHLTQKSLKERLLCLESSFLGRPEFCGEKYKELQHGFESLSHRVLSLEHSRDEPLYLGTSNTALESQVSQHDNLLGIHDVRLAEMDLHFQVLETATYNGRLVWKICDYKHRKQEAVLGRTLSLYSQPFYTSSAGYKMCVRIYLNGDGMGKGTHLSVFFVVMRGEYDSLLPWPFRQKVTLTLMDQGPPRHHISETFKPDPKSNSFRRPTSEMNIASGCPLFVSQPVLENSSYVKDDTIFIRVTVDTTDLPEL
nr:PREDICTED: TNF receptor-associated factor 3-like isoform X2 [Latimeria chalumnae]|eukprot:XP_014346563.1 PREDICTED: TNF receptor-associated factor 3-like isoform X2 [Latimeria chalumnae]